VFTSLCYGEAYDLQKFGHDPGYLKFTEENWNPYFYMSLLPFMGKAVRIYQKYRMMYRVVVVNKGKPPLPIFEVRMTASPRGLSLTSTQWQGAQVAKALQDQEPEDPTTIVNKSVKLSRTRPEEFPPSMVGDHMVSSALNTANAHS
jgi:hypothetical protein